MAVPCRRRGRACSRRDRRLSLGANGCPGWHRTARFGWAACSSGSRDRAATGLGPAFSRVGSAWSPRLGRRSVGLWARWLVGSWARGLGLGPRLGLVVLGLGSAWAGLVLGLGSACCRLVPGRRLFWLMLALGLGLALVLAGVLTRLVQSPTRRENPDRTAGGLKRALVAPNGCSCGPGSRGQPAPRAGPPGVSRAEEGCAAQ